MSDDLTPLDERGTAAAAALHAAVADHPIPELDPDLVRISLLDDPTHGPTGPGRRPDRRWLAVVGIAAALMVVGLGAALASRVDDDDRDPAEQVDTVTLRPHAAGWLPDGFRASSVVSGGATGTDAAVSRMVLLGSAPDRAELGLVVIPDSSVADSGPEELEQVGTAAGREVYRQMGSLRSYTFDVGDDQVAMIAGHDLDEEVVLAVAAEVAVEGDEVVVAALPDGWQRLGALDDAMGSIIGLRGGAGSFAFHATYTRGAPDDAGDGSSWSTFAVATTPGTDVEVAATGLFGEPEVVEVRGRRALLVRVRGEAFDVDEADLPEYWMVSWQERPGEVLTVSGYSVGRDDLLAVAEDVRPVSSTEWDDMVRASIVTPGPGEELLGTGEFSDGSPWSLLVDVSTDEGWAVLRTSAGGGSGGGTSSEGGLASEVGPDGEPIDVEPVLREVSWTDGGSFDWIYGRLGEGSAASVARIVVEDDSGAAVAEAVLVGEGDRRGWVVELPAGVVDLGSSNEEWVDDEASVDDGSESGGEGQAATTTLVAGGSDRPWDGAAPSIVAYAADGTELDRRWLP